MCDGSDVGKAVVLGPMALPVMAGASALKSIMPKTPDQPQVVREDPAAQQAKIESDAAQAAQAKTIEQRKRMRANSLLSRAGGAGDLTAAEVSTPTAAGKPNLGT